MNRKLFTALLLLLALLVGGVLLTGVSAAPQAKAPAGKEVDSPPPPKKLTTSVLNGLKFLAARQNKDGGWGTGEIGLSGRPDDPGLKGLNDSDVVNTSIAALAFLRAGYTPRQGTHSALLRRAIAYVCKEVEKSDKESLRLGENKVARRARPPREGDVQPHRVQEKIGPAVPAFLAALLLAEARGKMPDAKGEKRVNTALLKLVDKIQRNQKEDGTWIQRKQKKDGTWATDSWVPLLGQAFASRALNRARQVGIPVEPEKLERTAKHARKRFDLAARGAPEALIDAGGVPLYVVAYGIGGLHDSLNTVSQAAEKSRAVLTSPGATEAEREKAKGHIALADDAKKSFLDATGAVAKRATDPAFVAGFYPQTDGGEEFFCLGLIGEALRAMNAKEATSWDKAVADRLARTQNADGSWVGKHCIRGKTFCTAAALLALMTDRAPVPVAEKKK
jgi:hypothetical protein